MIELLLDTNVLIHLLHPTSSAEAGLTRQLLDWDRAGAVCLRVAAISGHEEARSPAQLVAELEVLGLAQDRIVGTAQYSDTHLDEISAILGHRKAGDWYDAHMVYTALNFVQRGFDMWLVTGDRNILRHIERLQTLGTLPIYSLRGVINQLRTDFPLTINRHGMHEGSTN